MKVNEIFYSLQGEGYHSGTPAVFVRFSGCNLRCPFCDTQHERGNEMSEEAIVAEVAKYPAMLVVVTGGEPSLQITTSLVDKLHVVGKRVAVETNGTRPLPENVDWITLSPKEAYVDGAEVVLTRADEVKVVYDGIHDPAAQLSSLPPCLGELSAVPSFPAAPLQGELSVGLRGVLFLFLQPMDTGDPVRNAQITSATVEYIKQHPEWCLSLQIHKILNIR